MLMKFDLTGARKEGSNEARGLYALRGFCYTPIPHHKTGFDLARARPREGLAALRGEGYEACVGMSSVELGIDGKIWVAYMTLQVGCSASMSMRKREAAICGISFNPFADRQSKTSASKAFSGSSLEAQFAGFRTV